MQRCIFSIITPVFSVTWSSEIILICWFTAQETFLIIINIENSCAARYFCGNWYILLFRIHRWIESSKEQHLFEIEIFCSIINVFTVTFDQFNAFFLNKHIQILPSPNLWTVANANMIWSNEVKNLWMFQYLPGADIWWVCSVFGDIFPQTIFPQRRTRMQVWIRPGCPVTVTRCDRTADPDASSADAFICVPLRPASACKQLPHSQSLAQCDTSDINSTFWMSKEQSSTSAGTSIYCSICWVTLTFTGPSRFWEPSFTKVF